MSYIEKKYFNTIKNIFSELDELDETILKLFKKKTITIEDEIAQLFVKSNKKINLILKKYYPEIKDLDKKLIIKSRMKFYYDLFDKLTDFIRNIENFQNIDENYFNVCIEFLDAKENLINNKYKKIVAAELTSFYDKKSREKLEKILESKLKLRNREYFTFGSLEQELKKISGEESLLIKSADSQHKEILDSAKAIIIIENQESLEEGDLNHILNNLKKFLESKGYEVKVEENLLITNIKLLTD